MIVPGSFRDPSGFLFFREGALYRQINESYEQTYKHFMESGLYQNLANDSLLVPHKEIEPGKVIKPELIPFISYPYEWCFSQLKDAALTTLKIQKRALDFGMSLKDCSAYNIQFHKGHSVFIDTLSFEKYEEGKPWVAYRQFCQHFLAPMALMSFRDIRLSQLFRVHIDGIPLDLASSLLPARTRLSFSLLSHIHLHAKSQKYFSNKVVKRQHHKINRRAFIGLLDNLEASIQKMKWKLPSTEWGDYYEDTNYSSEAFAHKKKLVAEFLNEIRPKVVWDFGANTGVFSRIASEKGALVLSFDVDAAAVEKNYVEVKEKKEARIFPLLLDLTNPSPGIGWAHKERMSLQERGPADVILALALVHHLAISNNVPLQSIASFFSRLGRVLIIEFIPKQDSNVQRLLATRKDIFPDYTQEAFEGEFQEYFTIQSAQSIKGSERILYLMKRHE